MLAPNRNGETYPRLSGARPGSTTCATPAAKAAATETSPGLCIAETIKPWFEF